MSDYPHGDASFLGKALYSFMRKAGGFLGANMWLWFILNLTWGLVGTTIGLIMALVMLCLPIKKECSVEKCVIRFIFGDNWGGLSGVFFIFVADNMGEDWTEHTTMHEIGHTFQNAVLGPLYPFLVLIPSAIRYWMFNSHARHGKPNPPYDGIWFEAAATDVGTEYVREKAEKA